MNQLLLYPLGFEAHEPLDNVLPDIYYWTQQFGCWFGLPILINGTLHLPVSANFQERAGACMEMMQF